MVEWHRQKFRLFWSRISRPWKRDGKAALRKEIRELIRRMASDNETWGAPRIHGELLKLGYKVSERTVSRYLSRLRPTGKSGNNWQTFITNHSKGIAALDFFTVPSLFFRQLYGFFIIRHDTR
ncbi:MAG: integrase, partial [bacterium]|nr:integrase [bacterium]